MMLGMQRRLAASVLKCSPKRVWFDREDMEKIKEAITKADIRGLVHQGVIRVKSVRGISHGRANYRQLQRSKGRQRGQGKRKGSGNVRREGKRAWINRIRLQRDLLKYLKEKQLLTPPVFRELYRKCKGGFFRSRHHLHLYITEHNLLKRKQ